MLNWGPARLFAFKLRGWTILIIKGTVEGGKTDGKRRKGKGKDGENPEGIKNDREPE